MLRRAVLHVDGLVSLTPNFQMDVVKRFAKRIARLTLVPPTVRLARTLNGELAGHVLQLPYDSDGGVPGLGNQLSSLPPPCDRDRVVAVSPALKAHLLPLMS